RPKQTYILDEEIVRRPVGDAMAGQLSHLLNVAGKPAVTIRIVPFSAGPHFGLRGPFVLLSFPGELDDVLYLESARRGDLLIAENKDQLGGPNVPKFENPAQVVAEYKDGFKSLTDIALSSDETLELIEGAIASLA